MIQDWFFRADKENMELQSIGLAGLEKAQERLAAAAKRLSTAGLQSPASGNERVSSTSIDGAFNSDNDSVDLSSAAVALLSARHSAEANLKIVETANELAAQTIDILG